MNESVDTPTSRRQLSGVKMPSSPMINHVSNDKPDRPRGTVSFEIRNVARLIPAIASVGCQSGGRPSLLSLVVSSLSLLLPIFMVCGCAPKASEKSPRSGPSTSRVRPISPGLYELAGIEIRPLERSIRFPAEINQVDQPLEYALVSTDGKTHESLLRTAVRPQDIHLAALLAGAVPSSDLGPTNETFQAPAASLLDISVEWISPTTQIRQTNRLDEWLGLGESGSLTITSRVSHVHWLYNGSFVFQGGFLAQEEGSIISLIRDPVALVNSLHASRDDDEVHRGDPARVPDKGTSITLKFRFGSKPPTGSSPEPSEKN